MATAELVTESALATLPTYTAADIFKPGFIDPIIDRIRAEVTAVPADISTEVGRKAIASLAHKVARSKTFIDDRRKELVAEEKARLKVIDQEGARIWDALEAIQKEVRKPLTDWEQAEIARITEHEALLLRIAELVNMPPNFAVADVEGRLERLEQIYARDWQEFHIRAKVGREATLLGLTRMLNSAKQAEADRIEIERLRAEQAERARVEYEARIAREATERAEAQARAREEAAARAAEAERERVEQERYAAEARAKQAEAQRIAEAERAEQARIAAERKAEADKQAAIEAERQRIEAVRRKEQEEAEARERNKRHVTKINREVRDSLVSSGLTEEQATVVVKAIAAGSIAHTKITY